MTDDQKEILNIAIRLLNLREHSQHELRRKLLKRKQEPDDIEFILDELTREGLQSDARFVEQYIHFRTEKGYGPRRLKMELKEKGLDSAMIESGLQAAEVNWFDLATKVWRKKFRDQVAENWQEKSRQMQFLDYRGFTQEQIQCCISEDEYD